MLKRKILTTLLIAAITVPSLLITAFATQHEFMTTERANTLPTRATFVTCSCYETTSSGITEHSGTWNENCPNDQFINGSYACDTDNYAYTSLTACAISVGYKDTYVYERNSAGNTVTDFNTNALSLSFTYPLKASVSPGENFNAICVRHEVTTPDAYSENSRWHARNYQ